MKIKISMMAFLVMYFLNKYIDEFDEYQTFQKIITI